MIFCENISVVNKVFVIMKTFLFIFLAGYAVRCDDNYYVVQIPDLVRSKEFRVYWNVPTMQCKSKKIPFDDLFEKYGIIQNTGDTHRGDKISILYDPGNFPALIKNGSTGEIRYRNGGVPQEGDLVDHLQNFKKEMERSIPDKDFSGVGIIDFESWRPILRQNFGSLTPYKDVSYDIERKRHWWWKKDWIQAEAKRRFEASGRDFMQTTIALAKKLRPKAQWGYYGYPQCFNRPFNGRPEDCADHVLDENDKINWLWSESTALFPSVYSAEDVTSDRLAAFIRGRIKESARVSQRGTPILPYWWFRYRDDGYFTETDLEASFKTFYNSNASGFIIWGSSKDVNTMDKCIKLREYVTEKLGPAIAKYTKTDTHRRKESDDMNDVFKPEVVTEFDPDYHWEPPENYTMNIEHIVNEELNKPKEPKFNTSGSLLIDLILNKIANFCLHDCGDDVSTKTPVILTTKNPFDETSAKDNDTVSTTTEEIIIKDENNNNSDDSVVTTIDINKTNEDTEITTTMRTEPNGFTTIKEFISDYEPVNSVETYTEDSVSKEIINESTTPNLISEDKNSTNISDDDSLIGINSAETNTEFTIVTENIYESTTTANIFSEDSTNPSVDDNFIYYESGSGETSINSYISNENNFNLEVTSSSSLSSTNFSLIDTSTTNFSLDNTSNTNLSSNDTSPALSSTTASTEESTNDSDLYDDLFENEGEIRDINTTEAPVFIEQVIVSVV